jgi:hypothetical protein
MVLYQICVFGADLKSNMAARVHNVYYLTSRSKVKVPRRSLPYVTHRLMVMHPHTKYHWPISKEKKFYGPNKKILFKKQLFELCLPFERRETYCFSLIFSSFCFFSAKLVWTITCLSFQIGQLYLVCGCLKRVIQLCDTNQVHNSDEGCNGHERYCCNLASLSSVNFHN